METEERQLLLTPISPPRLLRRVQPQGAAWGEVALEGLKLQQPKENVEILDPACHPGFGP